MLRRTFLHGLVGALAAPAIPFLELPPLVEGQTVTLVRGAIYRVPSGRFALPNGARLEMNGATIRFGG